MRPHYDDASLLAYLDRELRFFDKIRVNRHLGRCWDCRARLTELERQAHAAAQILKQTNFPKPPIEAAKRRFFEAVEDRRITFQAPGKGRRAPLGLLRLSKRRAAVGAGLLSCASAFAVWQAVKPSHDAPVSRAGRETEQRAGLRPTSVGPQAVSPSITIGTAPAPVRREPGKIHDAVPVDMDGLEVRIMFALHQAGGCLGEQVELDGGDLAGFLVHGVVASPERRRTILDRLAEVTEPGSIRIDLQTIEELAQASPIPEGFRSLERPAPETNQSRASHDELLQFFKNQMKQETGPELQRRISDVSNSAVNRANAALADGWALRHLCDRFPPWKSRRLSSDSRTMLAAMLQDHLNSLRAEVNAIRELIASENGDAGGNSAEPDVTEPGDWNLLVYKIFQSSSDVHGMVLRLFASAAPVEGAQPDSLSKLRAELSTLVTVLSRCSVKAAARSMP